MQPDQPQAPQPPATNQNEPTAAPPQPPVNAPQQPISAPPAENKTDILGILSIVFAFIGLQLVGFILGLIGASKAKKEGRSPVLSRVGWILNLVFGIIATLFLVFFFVVGFSSVQQSARNVERRNDLAIIAAELNTYAFNNTGKYPVTLDDPELSLSREALVDSQGNEYEYEPTPLGCTDKCKGYTLTARMEADETYSEGETYTINSTD